MIQYVKKMDWLKFIKEWIVIFLGCMMVAVAIEQFLVPHKIVNGGISGVSTILYYTTGIPVGTSYFVINLGLLLIAFKVLGWVFVARTLVVVAFISFGSNLLAGVSAFTDDICLATLFGALFYGLGLTIIFTRNATSGGTDVIGRLIQCVLPNANIGTLLLIIDGLIVLVSLLIFGEKDLCLWGFTSMAVCNVMIDMLIGKMNTATVLLVVTDKGDEMAEALMKICARGCTKLEATGAYTNQDRTVLVCAARSQEAAMYQEKIQKIDGNAFVMFTEAKKIVGEGFHVYH